MSNIKFANPIKMYQQARRRKLDFTIDPILDYLLDVDHLLTGNFIPMA